MKDIKQKIEESKVYISKEDQWWCEKPPEWFPTGSFLKLTTQQRPEDLEHFTKNIKGLIVRLSISFEKKQ
jgi:hypothetical protein